MKRFNLPFCQPGDLKEDQHGAFVLSSDFDALEAEAQALREEVAALRKSEIVGSYTIKHMAIDITAVGEALGISSEDQEGGTGEFIEAIQELQEELAALRARVVVTPSRRPHSPIYFDTQRAIGWNACLDELARLNSKAVSEGLLREAKRHLGNWLELHECECEGGLHYCGRDQVAKTHRELRDLLGEGKEVGDV